MAAGAWSNTFDRCARGHVVDYIGFRSENKKYLRRYIQPGRFLYRSGRCDCPFGIFVSECHIEEKERKKEQSGRRTCGTVKG